MTPQSRGKIAKTAVFRHRWQAWQVVRSIAAVRQRPRTPQNWRCSFTFFESFLWHFNEKQRGEVIFRHSGPVSCKNQENGAGKQWSVHAPLKSAVHYYNKNHNRPSLTYSLRLLLTHFCLDSFHRKPSYNVKTIKKQGMNGVYSLKWRLTDRYLRWGTLAHPRPGRAEAYQCKSSEFLHELRILGFPRFWVSPTCLSAK